MVILLVFEGGAGTFHTGIVVEEKRAGVVVDGVPIGVDEDRGRGQLGDKFPHNGLHGRRKDELDALFGKGGDGPYPLRHIGQKVFCNRKDHPKGSVAVLDLPAWAFSSAFPLFVHSA